MKDKRNFAVRFNLYTIIAVYFLIVVGGIVRTTGAGMGCPDWPKCFGAYTPPTDASVLPDNYREIFKEKRIAKNMRLSGILSALGFDQLAERVSSDPVTMEETAFDVEKAWVEYFNRLVGVSIGILIILNTWFSFAYWKENKTIPVLGVAGLVLVIFQGWIGSLVVSTNLLPGFISFHMILALLLVAILLTQQFMIRETKALSANRWLVTSLLVLFTVQIVLGTQVREQVDLIASQGVDRGSWIGHLGGLFYVHRSYSILLTCMVGALLYQLYRKREINGLAIALGVVVVLEIILGVVMAYFGVPAFAQPAHLLLGTVAFGVLFYLFLVINFKKASA